MSRSQHAQMLVVRKEGNAHAQYNSFRSAFELLEAVGREPHDCFEEIHEDLPPLQKLEQRALQMQQKIQQQIQLQIDKLKAENEATKKIHQQIEDLKAENKATRQMQLQIYDYLLTEI